MKLFKAGSGRSRQVAEPAQQPDESSIGSELSSRDQFDIVVRRQLNAVTANRTLSRNDPQKSRNGGLFGYLNNDDNDNSTVSSITVDETKKFGLFHSPKNRGFAEDTSNSSWCCCSDNTAPTEYTADSNTLMQSARSTRSIHASDPYTQARYRAITQQQQQLQARESWLVSATCAPVCGAVPEPIRVTKSRRPRLFRQKQPSIIASNKSSRSLMTSSLFDTLTEDWDEEDGGRRLSSVRRKSQQLRKSITSKRGKQQAV